MKLTQEQLLEIKNFISKKGYSEPDVQLELLDHLACGIEERMQYSNFDRALNDTYKSFGIFGFSDFVEGINKGHQKAVWTQIKSHLKTVFSFPWIIFTLLIIYSLYSATLRYSFSVPLSVLSLTTILSYSVYFRNYYQRERKYKNLGIIKNSNAFMGGAFGGIIGSFQIWGYFKTFSNPTILSILSILWIALYFFILLGAWVMKNHALSRAEELERTYGNLD